MRKEAALLLEEQVRIKKSLLAFIERVAGQDNARQNKEEAAILPQIVEITARLFYPFPEQSH